MIKPGAGLRVCFLTQWFDPEPGALRGLPLARWLNKRGMDVKVLTGFPNYPGGRVYQGYRIRPWQREVMDGIPVLRVPLYPSHDSTIKGRAANYGSFALSASTIGASLIGGADIGFVYHPPPTVGLAAYVMKKLRGMPFIYHIADMWPESVVESGMAGGGTRLKVIKNVLTKWCDWVYGQASAITVLSPGFKRLLIERGVPGEKIHVIYNWTDDTVFKPGQRDTELERELGFRGRFNVVYAGNMGVFQGLSTLIRAAVLVKHIPEVQIVLAGTGQQESELKGLAAELGADNVRFLGRRHFREMPKINDISDVLVVHLKDLGFFGYTIPSKTQVSMASGRPVLMAVRGDAADVINAARCGITCQPENEREMADAIIRLYGMGKKELDEMGSRGRRFYLDEMSLDRGGALMESLLHKTARGG